MGRRRHDDVDNDDVDNDDVDNDEGNSYNKGDYKACKLRANWYLSSESDEKVNCSYFSIILLR